uniref:Uncharacterized protein n=4 Tax=Meloidogyne TaxID=189290 RepID=A0A6V7V4H2_MELEN|nr:unnamed protein product [Meloidogyne enterolobii]
MSQQSRQLRNQVIQLYRTLYFMGKEYPKGSLWFHQRLKNAFIRNKEIEDEEKIKDLIKRGDYVVKELESLYQLRKYRALKSRYYD